MTEYKDIVISIIEPSGEEVQLASCKNDAKHVSAYKRLIRNMQIDSYNILPFLNQYGDNTTGFDISKHVSIQGNVVFFHTDVHNSFNHIKRASIVVPEELTDSQKPKLLTMLDNIHRERFDTYLGKVSQKRGKRKVIYQQICYDYLMSMAEQERGKAYVKR